MNDGSDVIETAVSAAQAADTAWLPILSGTMRERALAAIQEIHASIAASRSHANALALDADGSLSAGAAGVGVLYAELARAQALPDAATRRDTEIDRAVEILADKPLGASLYAGFSGIAWAAETATKLRTEQTDDVNEEIDHAVLQVLQRVDWQHAPFDLIYGIAGLGVYAAARMPRSAAAEALGLIVAELSRTAKEDANGVYWRTEPHNLLGRRRDQYPEGGVDLGVAHGISGVIPVLARAAALGVAEGEATDLADRAVTWLLAHAIEGETGATIPYFVAAGEEPTRARLAWCYGDPGVAAAILTAAEDLNRLTWIDAAKQLAGEAAARPLEASGVTDTGFCHGTAGLAHLFNRIYQATGEPSLRRTAQFWFEQTLDRLEADRDAAYNGLGLLEGAAGVALALLSAASEIEPQWDGLYVVAPLHAERRRNGQRVHT